MIPTTALPGPGDGDTGPWEDFLQRKGYRKANTTIVKWSVLYSDLEFHGPGLVADDLPDDDVQSVIIWFTKTTQQRSRASRSVWWCLMDGYDTYQLEGATREKRGRMLTDDQFRTMSERAIEIGIAG